MSRSHLSTRLAVAAAGLLLLAGAPAAVAGPLQGTTTVSTPENVYNEPAHRLAGDFNGDGFDDYVTTLDSPGSENMWTATVIFGSASLQNVELTRDPTTEQVDGIGSRGVQIRPVRDAAVNQYYLGVPTALAVGDVDRDGYDDVAISTPTRDKTSPHKAYVVYGGPGNGTISLGDPSRVTAIQVSAAGSDVRSDAKVSAIGDFDGDGYDDLTVTRSTGKASDYSVMPGATLIKGGPRVPSIDGTRGTSRSLLLTGQRTCRFVLFMLKNVCSSFTLTIVGIGDFNGDGKDDVVVDSGKDDSAVILLGKTGVVSATGSGTVKLDGATYARGWVPTQVARLGDVDGDGLADLGFSGEYPSGSNRSAMKVLRGRANPGSSIAVSGATTIQSASRRIVALTGAGDQDGDGRDEVAAVVDDVTDVDPFRREVKIVSVGSGTAPIQVDPIAPVPGLPTENASYYDDVTIAGGADFDRDGKPDLIYGDTYRPTMTIVSSGVDRAGPELYAPFSYGDDPANPAIRPGIKLEPYDFTPSAGTTRSVWVREAATIEFKVVRADGSVVGTTSRSVPAGQSSDEWNGTVNGTTLPGGRYTLEVTARDALGNRGHTRRYRFGIVDPGEEAGAPATILLKERLVGPDGTINGSGSAMEAEVGCSGNRYTQTLYPEPYADGASYRSGETCVLNAKPIDVFNRICDQDFRVTVNGTVVAGSSSGRATYRLSKGQNVVELEATCRERAAVGLPGPLATDGWVARGDVWWGANPEEIWLATQPGHTSSTVWNAPFDPRERTIELASYVGGGTGSAEGITLSLLPADQTSPATGFIGAGGARLGVGGLPAVGVALDFVKGTGDPRANNVGLFQGTTSSGLNWLQSADGGTKLNAAGTWVTTKLVSKAGKVSVYVNGSLRLTRTQTLPASAYLAFTGANGSAFQELYLGRVKVTSS